MADERLKKDANYYPVVGGLTDDANLDIVALRVDPVTKRLLTDTSVSSVTISGGTIDVLSSGTVNTSVTIGSLQIADGTLTSGTINVKELGSGTVRILTLPTVTLSNGTVSISNTLTLSNGTVGVNSIPTLIISDGTLSKLPTITIGGGSMTINNGGIAISGGSLTVNNGTITTLSAGTVNSVINSGTITSVLHSVISDGSLTINSGTISSITDGTIHVHELAAGTVTVTSLPTLFISDGSLTKLPTIFISDGTLSKLPTVTIGQGSMTINVLPTATIGGGSLTVNTGTIAVLSAGTVNAVINSGTVTTVTSVLHSIISDGSLTVNVLPTATIGGGSLTINTGTISCISDGTVHIHELGSGTITIGSGTVSVAGPVAHDTADSGNPVKMGAKATTALSGLTMVATNDRTDLFAGVDGVQFVRPYTGLEDIVSSYGSATTTGTTYLIAAQGSGIKTYITSISIVNDSATNTSVYISDGTYTNKWIMSAPANGGAIQNFAVPLAGTANTYWAFNMTTAAGSIRVAAVGFKSKI